MNTKTIETKVFFENWQIDPSGFFATPPSLESFLARFSVVVSLKKAFNMQKEETRSHFLRRLDLDPFRLAVSYQCHGTQIHTVRSLEDCPTSRVDGVDGWIASNVEGVNLGIFTADCLGIFILHREYPMGILLHGGWKGLSQGIIAKALELCRESVFKDTAAHMGDFFALIGPHVRSCCYEVGDEVGGLFPKDCLQRRGDKIYLDLERVAVGELAKLNIPDVFVSKDCTCCRSDLFFSFRHKDKGSMLNLLSFA